MALKLIPFFRYYRTAASNVPKEKGKKLRQCDFINRKNKMIKLSFPNRYITVKICYQTI